MTAQPGEITVDHDRRLLSITWKDGHVSDLSFDLLRKECPCATCNDRRQKMAANPLSLMTGPVITQAEVTGIEPMGRYALQFTFNDGHDTGIYTHEYLRSLCRCPDCAGAAKRSG